MIDTIKQSIPNLIDNGKIKDRQLNQAIEKYVSRIKGLNEAKMEQRLPHCLFDWILLAENNDKKAKSFIKYLERNAIFVFENTSNLVSKKVRSIISNIVLSIDTDINIKNNPQYLNFTGELIGLNHILRTGNNQFELKEIEVKLPNKKQVDFVFKDKKTEEMLYVDFVSIHHIDISKLDNDDELILFLENRFNAKLKSKTNDLNENLNKIIVNGKEFNFAILPIIWTEINTLLPFKDAFNKINEKYANVFLCCSLLPQELDNEEFIYNFCSVSNILEMWDSNK